MSPDQSIYISQSDVAKLFGVTTITVWRWVNKKPWLNFPKPARKERMRPRPDRPGRLDAGRVYYLRTEIEAYHKQQLADFIERRARAA